MNSISSLLIWSQNFLSLKQKSEFLCLKSKFYYLGAKLKGSFSRYDFQRNPQSGPSAVKSYKTILPAAAKDVYYRDEIGNISTSHLREDDDSVELELRPR